MKLTNVSFPVRLNLKSISYSLFFFGAVPIFWSVPQAQAEEKFEDLIARAVQFKNDGKIPQALGELSWAQKQLEELHAKKLQSFFKSDISGFTAAEAKTDSSPLGVVVTKNYTDPQGTVVKATLAGPASTNSARADLSLGGLAQMAVTMGGAAPGTESIQINGERALLAKDGHGVKLLLTLPNNLVMTVDSKKGQATKEQLVAVAEGLDLKGLQSYFSK